MYHDFTYEGALAASLRAQWQLDDVLRADQDLDFSRNFMPASLAGTADLPMLSPDERRLLNQITGHQYLWLFGSVEEFILPFVLDHARPMLRDDDLKIRALLNFAAEEAKHIHLFRRFHEAFVRGFPVPCRMIGPSERLGAFVLSHHPLAVGLAVLMIEWMTQAHYVGSIKDDGDCDPLFRSLLKNHWIEESQHAKLDTLIVDALARRVGEDEVARVTDEFFHILGFLDRSLRVQAGFNIDSLERAAGRRIAEREQLVARQHRSARWTYLGSGLTHPRFNATVRSISSRAHARIAQAAARLGAGTAPGAEAAIGISLA
ncbi:MAG TPA: diiron oxygenase [Sphingomicrobium sp.]|jgi:hypothetical protein|nr:diiron oxygenase [Sphingomicrobium sp.]